MCASSGNKKDISRRAFIRTGAAGLGAAIVSGRLTHRVEAAEEAGAQKEAPTVEKRSLGRTGQEVSVVGFGTYGFSNPGVLEKAIEAGINFILTDRSYGNGNAEKAIGEVLKKVDRKKVVVGTGWAVSPGVTKGKLLEMLDGSLKRLQTDSVDLLRAFMVNDPKVLEIEEQFEAFEEAKKAGKARFYGVSAHGGNLLDVFNAAADSGKFDYVMGRYNFMEHEKGEAFVKKLAEKKIGFVGFKIEAGKRGKEVEEFQKGGLSARAAAVKWALQNPCVTSILGMIRSFEAIEEYLRAAREKLTAHEEQMLRRYVEIFDSEYCRNCGTCQQHCPHGVAIADVMRYCMYFKYYETEKEARRLYAELPPQVRPSVCYTCAGHCAAHCPHRLQVRQKLLEADRLLA
jgi:predicted aldo/keto reductase-like oxidoreductase